jgi:hypothetical protein
VTSDPRTLYLRLPDRDAREQAALLLMPFPGPVRVVFSYPDGSREDAPHNLSVDGSLPLQPLAEAFGSLNVVLK